MSSKAKKKPSTPAPEKQKEIKIPKAFIVRPLPAARTKSTAKIGLHPDVFNALGLRNAQLILLTKSDANNGVVGTVAADSEISDNDIVHVSAAWRKLGGLLLGDRVQVSEYLKNIDYADSVTVMTTGEDTDLTAIEKQLNDVGLVAPGLNLQTLRVVDVNSEIEDAMNNLTIEESQEIIGTSVVSPHYIFAKGKTKVIITTEEGQLHSKYPNLPHFASFSQVGGLNKQTELLQSTIKLPLHNPKLFSDFGISPPRGILLHGPPGTGKTMLLRCVASEVDAHILSVNGPSIVSKYLGETENALRSIFQEARKFQPSIVFMDEIDSLAPNRNSDDSGETESRVVATLLTMMDGLGDSGRIVVVGATNRPNSIDPALRRPGRFDQEVEIGIPDVEARFDILTKQFARMDTSKHQLTSEDINMIASKTHGYVGADLVALCRESVMKAINRGLKSGVDQKQLKLTSADVSDALPEIRPSAMREIFLEVPKVFWTDIGGQEDLKKKLVEVVQLPLEAAATFSSLGISAPKGVLLYGPPGCSKTLTAKALATESGLNFLAVKGPEIFQKYVGESERTIREIFRKARAASPSIIFFDEIDAISSDRDGGTSAAQHVLTSLLNEIDGVEELKGVVIVAATNRPTEIDPALLRPGRLDRHIYVAPPDYDARLQIITKNSRRFKVDNQKTLFPSLAADTEGCSGAEVALLCQEAGLSAIMENNHCEKVEERHFVHALNGISRGITPGMLQYYEDFSQRSGLGK